MKVVGDMFCEECSYDLSKNDNKYKPVVNLGYDKKDFESSGAFVCAGCLREALALLEGIQ